MDAGGRPLLEVDIVRKAFATPQGEVIAIEGLSFAIGRGEFVCLIGPSGCGKTTTLRILMGLDRAFTGRISPDPRTLRPGVVFQEPRLLPWRSVGENIRIVLPPAERSRDIEPLLAELGIGEWRRRYPGEISLGMARRVALARALVGKPDILVLDEPFVSLDEAAADELRACLLRPLARSRDEAIAVLMVTHNLREALALADRLVLLTPRPAKILTEVALDTPRAERDRAWIEAQRDCLAASVLAGAS